LLDRATNTIVRSFDHLTLFCTSQLDFSIIRHHRKLCDALRLFHPTQTDRTAKTAIASRFRHLENRFLFEDSADAPDRRVNHKGGLFATQIDNVVISHSVPFLAPLTATAVAILRHHWQPFLQSSSKT
jgi:hypothetical protein